MQPNTSQYYGWGLPINISTYNGDIDSLINILHIFMFILFIGWSLFLLFTLFKFRQRPGHKAEYHGHHFKAPTYIEVGVALFEVLLLVGFSFPIVYRSRNPAPSADQAFQVRVVGEQYAWNIHYPGPDGKFGKTDIKLISPSNPLGVDRGDADAKDDITAVNQLHIPVDKPVIAYISSKDVIHSFSLPVMRVKQDAVPGQITKIWFQAKQTGMFEINCAQLCGLGHYRMRGFFFVETSEQNAAWLAKMAPKKPVAPVQAVVASVVNTVAAATPSPSTVQ